VQRAQMKKLHLVFMIMPLLLFSQQWNERARAGDGLVGVSVGLLVEGQTRYPTPYYGPEVNGLFNDGAYHLILDIYYDRFIFGVQLSDEFLFLEKFENNAVWKPRGFNKSYASLTRTYWLTVGYNVLLNLNIKGGVGYRRGPLKPLTNRGYTATEVAQGFDYSNPESIYNTTPSLNTFSEIDYSISITYPIKVFGKFGLVPEIGYTIKHGGLLTGISIIY